MTQGVTAQSPTTAQNLTTSTQKLRLWFSEPSHRRAVCETFYEPIVKPVESCCDPEAEAKPKAKEILPLCPVSAEKKLLEIKKGRTVPTKDPRYCTLVEIKSTMMDSSTRNITRNSTGTTRNTVGTTLETLTTETPMVSAASAA